MKRCKIDDRHFAGKRAQIDWARKAQECFSQSDAEQSTDFELCGGRNWENKKNHYAMFSGHTLTQARLDDVVPEFTLKILSSMAKNYFLSKANMSETAQQKIAAFPDAVEFNLAGEFGWVVEDTQLSAVLELIGAENTKIEEPTSFDGLFKLGLWFDNNSKPQTPQFKSEVVVDPGSTFKCDHWISFHKRIKEWLEQNIPITTEFYICSKGGEPQPSSIPLSFKLSLGTKEFEILDSEKKIVIKDNINGFSVQCYKGKNIISIGLLPQCPGEVGDGNFNTVIGILKKFLPLALETDPKKIADMILMRAEAENQKNRDAYVKACSKRFEQTLKGTEEGIKVGYQKIQNLQSELTRTIRETKGKEQKLEQLKSANGMTIARYAEEYEKLVSLPKVKKVTVDGGEIKVFTTTLCCVDPRTSVTHEIGEFEIRIPTSESGSVAWFNLTRRVNGYASNQSAPHIWENGTACLGNTQEIFPELIASYEFASVALVAIQFVESVNVDDAAGKHINRWPIKE